MLLVVVRGIGSSLDELLSRLRTTNRMGRRKGSNMKKYQIIAALFATILTMRSGVNVFEGHKETYYNLPMRKVCDRAANNGLIADYSESEDGLKMYGPFVIVAADWNVHPYGSIVNTSRGIGIVLDTGDFAKTDNQIIDIAVTW